jgi:hypothetical protein
VFALPLTHKIAVLTAEYYDLNSQKPSEGQRKYHLLLIYYFRLLGFN